MAGAVFEFGDFKLDCGRFELLRDGSGIRLERKPMELLVLLVSSEGRLLSRGEIAKRLWDSEVFVDTEHGINTAIRKIRTVLHDDPEKPRFIQTVTGMGYRFIAPVTLIQSQNGSVPGPAEVASQEGLTPGEMPEEHPSVAEAPADIPGSTLGVKPPPPAVLRRPLRVVLAGLAAGLAIAALVVGFGARVLPGRLVGRGSQPAITSLAVLPLANLSGDPGQDYFADGMTDEVTTMLAKDSTLRIVSRTSAMQYKEAHRSLPEIARALHADGILEGSVSRSGDKVHMTLQLIRADTDTHLWAESYDRGLNDATALPREVADSIAKRLNSTVPSLPPARYVSSEAHDAYVHGRYLWTAGYFEAAQGYLHKAVELQPDYALGWSGLSDYYGAGAVDGLLDPRQGLPQMEAAATKALQLDESLPQAHLSMAATYFFSRWDLAAADREILRAIELDPKFAEAIYLRALILTSLNRYQEAIELEKKAMEIDPFAHPYALASFYNRAREFDAGLKEAVQRLQSTPSNIRLNFVIAEAYWNKGMKAEAVQAEEKAYKLNSDKESALGIRHAFQQGGSKAVVRWQIERLKRSAAKHYISPVDLASHYGELGERDKTLALLEEAYRHHVPSLLWVQCDPAFDFLHSEERYRAIVRGVGLPPAY